MSSETEPGPHVVLVAGEILGPYLGGGIATSVFGLAAALAPRLRVTVLYVGSYAPGWNAERAAASYARLGIGFVDPRDPDMQVRMDFDDHRTRSWLALEALKRLAPDLAVFHDYGGLGFYPALDRAQGGALSGLRMLTVLHGPTRWARGLNADLETGQTAYVLDHMERVQAELSDHVSAPSAHILDWVRQAGWAVDPDRASVERNIVALHPVAHYATHPIAEEAHATPAVSRKPVEEFVFFGRLERRKGLVGFCHALDRLVQTGGPLPARVTFLGRALHINGVDSTAYVLNRSDRWPFALDFREGLAPDEALDLLAGPGRLAVIPSLEENAPCVVVECIGRGVPFLTTLEGGTAELLDPASRAEVALPQGRSAMAARLARALEEGAAHGRLSYAPADAVTAWVARIDAVLALPAPRPALPAGPLPLVSVVLTHMNRPGLLRDAVASVLAQDHPEIELIIVDDGSRPEVQEALRRDYAGDPRIRLVFQENAYLGAARNAGIRAARGEYIKFMDDDNIALPDEISSLLQAARVTGAALVTCFSQMFATAKPETEADITAYYLPLGGGITVNLFSNFIGDANALVHRDLLEDLDGFTEDYGVGFEDYELFLRAVLLGRPTTVVPRPLFWYRVGAGSMLQAAQSPESLAMNRGRVTRVFRDLAERLPRQTIADLADLASAGVLLADTEYQRAQIWRSALPDHVKRLRTGFGQGPERREDIARLMLAKGRIPEAVRWMGGELPAGMVAEVSRRLIEAAPILTGAATLSDNRLPNPDFAGVAGPVTAAPYAAICDHWHVPQARSVPRHVVEPLAGGGISVALRDFPTAWEDGSYILLRSGVGLDGLSRIEGTALGVTGRVREGGPLDLRYFLRLHRDSGFKDVWSVVGLTADAGLRSDHMRIEESLGRGVIRVELFLQLYLDRPAVLDFSRVELRLLGRVAWSDPARIEGDGV